MLSSFFAKVRLTNCAKVGDPLAGLARAGCLALCAVAVLAAAAGCNTPPPRSAAPVPPGSTNKSVLVSTNSPELISSNSLLLQEGDTIRISFPGAPNLDTTLAIRRDGKITLPMTGEEYDVSGKTPTTLEVELKKHYASLLETSDVSVTVVQSAFVVYVMGTVGRPGRLISERHLNVLEALIEAGVDGNKANLKAIQVFRTDSSGKVEKSGKLNYYKYLHDKHSPMPSFTLKPYDIIFVPDRFSLFQ